MPVSLILAGGEGRRLGRPKGLLRIGQDLAGQRVPMIDLVVDALRRGGSERIIVATRDGDSPKPDSHPLQVDDIVADADGWTGPQAGLYIVYAVTDPEGRRGGNIGAFIVERAMDGVTVGKKEEKLGLRGSSTTEMIFEDVFVPDENLMGDGLNGFKIALDTLDGGRIGIAAQALGIHRACLEESVKYSKEREQFGKPIGTFQGIAWKLADMATELEAARALLYLAAAKVTDNAPDKSRFSAMAKRLATDSGSNVVNNALQLFGGYGYLKEYPIERFWRDLRVHSILEGTNQVMRMIVGRDLLRQ